MTFRMSGRAGVGCEEAGFVHATLAVNHSSADGRRGWESPGRQSLEVRATSQPRPITYAPPLPSTAARPNGHCPRPPSTRPGWRSLASGRGRGGGGAEWARGCRRRPEVQRRRPRARYAWRLALRAGPEGRDDDDDDRPRPDSRRSGGRRGAKLHSDLSQGLDATDGHDAVMLNLNHARRYRVQ